MVHDAWSRHLARGRARGASPARGYAVSIPDAVTPIETVLLQPAIVAESSDSMLVIFWCVRAGANKLVRLASFFLQIGSVVCVRTRPNHP